MDAADPFDLERFVVAQARVYAQVCAELARGYKTSHWMWFVFPQLKALGRSATAQRYGISGRAEALAYWQHALLGARLRECTGFVLQVQGRTLRQIFGSPDDLKFVSCMTLFGAVAPEEPAFAQAIERLAGGCADARTVELL
jgi:uncharacterized protein (DUF1810 family)